MKRKRFIKINEGFKCEHCGSEVSALTHGSCRNHCPYCLYSKHVDEDLPGDRLSVCHGLMEPVGLEKRGGEWVILHRCVQCKVERRNQTAPDDDSDRLVVLSTASL